MVYRVSLFYGDACQTAAIVECTASYAGYAIGYSYPCQASAIVKCIISYACSTGYNHFLKRRRNIAAIIRIARRTKYISEMGIATASRSYKGYGYACQTAATGECRLPYACYAVRYGYTCQTAAIVECTASYASYAIGYGYACQTTAIVECTIQYVSTRYSYALKR